LAAALLIGGVATAQAADEHKAKADESGKAAAADNTGKNVRDRDTNTMVPTDQAENKADLTITQNIRKAVVDDDGLSTTAKNVKIVTANGVVTLRGPVKSAAEKASIEAKARKVAPEAKVQNQLEVAPE
jgi:hyperosmotically inducible periplasmic protein